MDRILLAARFNAAMNIAARRNLEDPKDGQYSDAELKMVDAELRELEKETLEHA